MTCFLHPDFLTLYYKRSFNLGIYIFFKKQIVYTVGIAEVLRAFYAVNANFSKLLYIKIPRAGTLSFTGFLLSGERSV